MARPVSWWARAAARRTFFLVPGEQGAGADFADNAGPDAGVLDPVLELADVEVRQLVAGGGADEGGQGGVDVVPRSADDVDIRPVGDLRQPDRVPPAAGEGQLGDGFAAVLFEQADFPQRGFHAVQHALVPVGVGIAADAVEIVQGYFFLQKGLLLTVLGLEKKAGKIAENMLVRQRGAQFRGVHRAQHRHHSRHKRSPLPKTQKATSIPSHQMKHP